MTERKNPQRVVGVRGERVWKRGGESSGTIVDVQGRWVSINWDLGPIAKLRPRICHLDELEKAQ